MNRGIVVAGGVVALQLLSCSSDPPLCPTGNCNLPGSTVVTWLFDHYPNWMFGSDTCTDMGVSKIHVDAVNHDDATITASLDADCGEGQLTFVGLAAGNYDLTVAILDSSGNPLVTSPIAASVAAGATDAPTMVEVDVPYTAWSGTYTGTFLFRLSWGGMSCSMAVPPVQKQVLTLTSGGHVVTQVTDTGQKLDGTDPENCRELTEPFAQFAEGLPFGPATLLVVGKVGAAVKFQHQYDTFVGAGKNNPTLTFDVPPPDAGVDAPVDAAVDAALHD